MVNKVIYNSIVKQQEAQLSQTDRATLCVIEYLFLLSRPMSLKVIRDDTLD